jgi:uncharacterized DUF497 family protein
MDVRIQIEGQWFEWDAKKSARNLGLAGRAHLAFENALSVFFNAYYELSSEDVNGEIRTKIIGTLSTGKPVVVVYTERKFNGKESIRIISARPASASERRKL